MTNEDLLAAFALCAGAKAKDEARIETWESWVSFEREAHETLNNTGGLDAGS